ncbi:SgcJ/EcaC family oxidoreductase [Winogradskya humida]|nr:SgcJ/EcaC family oxidoreductase [Actinoplanes humidus]
MSAEITGVYKRLLDAWNGGDAEAAAALFADDALVVGFDGGHIGGVEVPAGGTYVAKIRRVWDGRMVHAIVGVVPPGSYDLDPALNAVHTVVVEDGKIVLFQSTPAKYMARPDLAASHNAELTPLLLTGDTLG